MEGTERVANRISCRPETMMKTSVILGTLLTGSVLLAACSSVPYAQRLRERQAAYAAAAGAPVRHFDFFTLYSWESLGDSQLAVYTRPNKAWLLDVSPHCPRLDYRNSIAITSFAHQVSAGFDKVLTGSPVPCVIERIRPLDMTRLKTLERAQHAITTRPRPTAAG
jgi:hypothetical protein